MPGWPGHADGRAAAALLGARPPFRGPAGTRLRPRRVARLRRGLHGLPRHQRPHRHPRGALPPSPRPPVLRPQRGARAALHLPRLEVRRRGQLHRHALRACPIRVLEEGAPHRLPRGGVGRRHLGLLRPRGQEARAPAGRVVPRAPVAPLHREVQPGVQLRAGHGGRHRLQSHRLPAPGARLGHAGGERRVQVLAQRQVAALDHQVHRLRHHAGGAAQCGRGHPLLAHQPVAHALLHDDCDAGRPAPRPRPHVGARRRTSTRTCGASRGRRWSR